MPLDSSCPQTESMPDATSSSCSKSSSSFPVWHIVYEMNMIISNILYFYIFKQTTSNLIKDNYVPDFPFLPWTFAFWAPFAQRAFLYLNAQWFGSSFAILQLCRKTKRKWSRLCRLTAIYPNDTMLRCTCYLKFRTYLTQQKISVDDREIFGKLLLNLINSATYSRHHYVSVYITLNLWREK